MSRVLARRLAMCVLSLLLVALSPLSNIPPAAAQTPALSPEDEATYVANINSVRAANGLGPVRVDPNMTAAARSWAIWMAENKTLQHAGDIVTGAPADWQKVGENVGRGGSVDAVWKAFLASPTHAANVLDPVYELVGIGVVWTEDGRMYTTHRFASTSSGSAAPPPAPPAEPPAQLPFVGIEPVAPPAEPARLAMTMALLLTAAAS